MPNHKKKMEFDHIETPTLTKAQLADMLHQEVGLNKRESKDIVDAFFCSVMPLFRVKK
jgi:integration host factor subunit alpha